MINDSESQQIFKELLAIVDRLRDAGGCPWDREQTRMSLKPYVIEEAYEVVEAIEKGNPDKIREELGDLLYQIFFQAKIGKEKQEFTMGDIMETLRNKMIRRHPHVFGNTKVNDSKEVLQNWEKIKSIEKNYGKNRSLFSGTPRRLPTVLKAQRLQEKAAMVGFDWNNYQDIIKKIQEEINELKIATEENDSIKMEEELGDLMFSVVNLGRFLKLDSDNALRKSTDKFLHRFQKMEKIARNQGKSLSSLTMDELECLWQETKNH